MLNKQAFHHRAASPALFVYVCTYVASAFNCECLRPEENSGGCPAFTLCFIPLRQSLSLILQQACTTLSAPPIALTLQMHTGTPGFLFCFGFCFSTQRNPILKPALHKKTCVVKCVVCVCMSVCGYCYNCRCPWKPICLSIY